MALLAGGMAKVHLKTRQTAESFASRLVTNESNSASYAVGWQNIRVPAWSAMGFPAKDVVLIERFPNGVFLCGSFLARCDWPVWPKQWDLANLPNAIHFIAGYPLSLIHI